MKIFKNLFKAKWQSDDAQVRLKAIEELTLSQHQKELHALAKDSDANVKLAALTKLNNFQLWLNASESDKDNKVKTKAEAQVKAALLGTSELKVDDSERNTFLRESAKPALLEELLPSVKDSKLLLSSLEKLGKETLSMQYLLAANTADTVKQALFDKIDSKDAFERVAKKAVGTIKAQAEEKLSALRLAEVKPAEVQKQVSLVLAKLNALRDKSDIVELEEKRQNLESEWAQLSQEMHWLAEEAKEEAEQKLNKIQSSLDALMGPLKEQWELAQAQVRLQQAYDESTKIVSDKLSKLQNSLGEIITSVDRDDDVDVLNQIQSIEKDLDTLQLPQAKQKHFVEQLESMRETLSEVPKVHQTLEALNRELGNLEALALPTDTESLEATSPEFHRIKKAWREMRQSLPIAIPQALDTAFNETRKRYQEAAEPLQQQQKEKVQQFKKKQNELKRLLFSGKYRSAFGLHKKLTNWLAQISTAQRDKLKVEFDKLTEKVKELQELQSFIALPRKQELLEQLQTLAKEPLEDVIEQGERVKKARADWNSLGKTDSSEDAELNRAFNQACEDAFAPCRAYYAEQEKLRNDNLLAKHKLLDELRELHGLVNGDSTQVSSEETPDQEEATAEQQTDSKPESSDIWSKVESGLARITREWRNIGEIDRAELSNINKLYTELTKPLRKQLNASYQSNAERKQSVIEQAKQLFESDDIFAAVNTVKSLQKEWKTIGFAGPANEKLLWKAFREVNDALFSKRDEQKQTQKAEQAEEIQHVITQLAALDAQLNAAVQLGEIKQVEQAISALESKVAAVRQNNLQAQLKSLANRAQSKAKQLLTAKHQAEIAAVFDAMARISEGSDADLTSVDGQWVELLNQSQDADSEARRNATIRLEVIAGVASPVSEEARRWEVKVKMMTDKLQEGEQDSLIDGLKQWLALGRLTAAQSEDLQRVKAIFLTATEDSADVKPSSMTEESEVTPAVEAADA